ncbi:MAG: nuclear transport factor 2 family protein [Betaproteobacteria bacterium]
MNDEICTEDKAAIEALIKQFEEARIKATIEADIVTLDGILADDLVWTHASGNSDTKMQWMGKVESRKVKYTAFTFDHLALRVFKDCVIINGTGTTSVFHNGGDDKFNMSITAVYVNYSAGWRLAAMHVTKR